MNKIYLRIVYLVTNYFGGYITTIVTGDYRYLENAMHPHGSAAIRNVLFASMLLLGTCSAVNAGDADVTAITAAREGEYVYFTVDIIRPDDMADLTIEDMRLFRTTPSFRPCMAELSGRPMWRYPCALEYSRPDAWSAVPRLDRLTYVGRCPADEKTLTLTLRIPLADGSQREESVALALDQASAPPADPPIVKRWAAAQIAWWTLFQDGTGDPGGFYTYAIEQTRRQHDVPKPEEDASFNWRRRTFETPEEQMIAVTTGALAVQESLQLDRMTNTERDSGAREVNIADIPAVGVKSHPFDRMRGERQPACSALARLVPEDFYYLRVGDLARFYELLDFVDDWGTSLLRIAAASGEDYGVRERIHKQLCLPETFLARMLGPKLIEEMALVGSDPYLREGSDVTILFRVKAKEAFLLAVNPHIQEAKKTIPEAVADAVEYKGVSIERLIDPQRQASCHRCWLDDVCVYGNSQRAIERIIDAQAGRRPSLADAPDFKYMRAVSLPLDSEREDVFLFLSDPFIRRLVGPELRIKEKRRLETITSLKMLENAALLHGYLFGPGAPTYDELVQTGCLKPEDLCDHDGGTFMWDAQRGVATSSTYGQLGFLKPLIEIEAERCTAKERTAYEGFRNRYQQYWRRYFDPIGMRVQVKPTLKIETCILPLIDESTYEQMFDLASGDTVDVPVAEFTPDTLLRTVLHLNEGTAKAQAIAFLSMVSGGTNAASDWVGDWVTFWVEDTDAFQALLRREFEHSGRHDPDAERQAVPDVFNTSFVLGVHCRNKISLTAFLVALRTFIMQTAPNTVFFNNLEPYQDVVIVQIAPNPRGELARELLGEPRTDGTENEPATPAPTTAPAVSEQGPAVYYATIGDGFYLSTQAGALRRLIDQRVAARTAEDSRPPVPAHMLLYVAPAAAEKARPTVSYFLEQQAYNVTAENLVQLWLLGRCGVLDRLSIDDATRAYLGHRLVCPDGGEYRYDAKAAAPISSVHGVYPRLTRLEAPPAGSPLRRVLDSVREVLASLQFTEEGLTTTVEIRRQ